MPVAAVFRCIQSKSKSSGIAAGFRITSTSPSAHLRLKFCMLAAREGGSEQHRGGMHRALRARLGAARLVLEEHTGHEAHAIVSRVQAAAVCEAVKHCSELSPEARAELVDLVLRMQWHAKDSMPILELLAPPTVLPAVYVSGRPLSAMNVSKRSPA